MFRVTSNPGEWYTHEKPERLVGAGVVWRGEGALAPPMSPSGLIKSRMGGALAPPRCLHLKISPREHLYVASSQSK